MMPWRTLVNNQHDSSLGTRRYFISLRNAATADQTSFPRPMKKVPASREFNQFRVGDDIGGMPGDGEGFVEIIGRADQKRRHGNLLQWILDCRALRVAVVQDAQPPLVPCRTSTGGPSPSVAYST